MAEPKTFEGLTIPRRKDGKEGMVISCCTAACSGIICDDCIIYPKYIDSYVLYLQHLIDSAYEDGKNAGDTEGYKRGVNDGYVSGKLDTQAQFGVK